MKGGAGAAVGAAAGAVAVPFAPPDPDAVGLSISPGRVFIRSNVRHSAKSPTKEQSVHCSASRETPGLKMPGESAISVAGYWRLLVTWERAMVAIRVRLNDTHAPATSILWEKLWRVGLDG